MIYIIGSGLSGIAAAVALVKRGFRPTILDAGLNPDREVTSLKAKLASVEPEDWNPDDVAYLKRTGPETSSGIPQKLYFGSDFAYRDADKSTSPLAEYATMTRSFARGGFSNVWGAVVQQFPESEFRNWPVGFRDLAPHYDAIRRLMFHDSERPVRATTQAQQFFEDLARYRYDLGQRGIQFDYARTAVRTSDNEDQKGCRSCGLCLYGCPYDSIFNSTSMLSKLIRQGSVSYVPGVIVDSLSASDRSVKIEVRNLDSGAPHTFEGQVVFLAAGLLESTRIVLNSTKSRTDAIRIQQSDIFTVPLIRYRSPGLFDRERLSTLAQLVLRIDDAGISPHAVHLQLYGYNDLYMKILERRAGPLGIPLKPTLRTLADRLFVAFGYLHSDVSSSVRLVRSANGGRLHLEGQINPESRRIGRAIVKRLFQNRKYFRALPLSFALRFDAPGASFRSGGSLPMKPSPAVQETDPIGRLPGLARVHVVDASVLPSIAAGPIAFTSMANAHRIASECPIPDVR